MGAVITYGKSGASELFGGIFPECPEVAVDGNGSVRAGDGVIIFAENCHYAPEGTKALAAVINGDTSFDASNLKETQIITCGIGAKNTISVTSRTADSMTLSLNRSLQTLKGICEPQELPIKTPSDAVPYDYMSAYAASLVLGKMG